MGRNEIYLNIVLFNFFFIIFIVGIVIFIRQYQLKKKEHNAMLLLQHEEHQKELLTNHIEIQNQTMQHIGREIHDNIGQKLTLASLYTQQLAYENKAPHITKNIEIISNIINESLADLRDLSKTLTDDNIAENNVYKLILIECEKVKNIQKCAVNFACDESNTELEYQYKSIITRITQEFIQNSLKYSKCKTINIQLNYVEKKIIYTLSDDGIGFDVAAVKNKGIGLSNMKKRTELLNGVFYLKSIPNRGTLVEVIIPLPAISVN